MNMKCPICGKTEFENNYDRCEFCEWMNDYYQMIHPNRTGVNPVSLNQAKKNFKITGTIFVGEDYEDLLEWRKKYRK